jgi:hypothetical protein
VEAACLSRGVGFGLERRRRWGCANRDTLAGLKGEATLEKEAALGKAVALEATAAVRLPRSPRLDAHLTHFTVKN